MIPVAGSAYTYSYATMGEFLAWTVGWALVLEYAIAASAVSVGWSGFFTGTILQETFGIALPAYLTAGPLALGGAPGGFINLPALVIALLVTWLLMIGTSESAKVNAVLVTIKLVALTAFIILTLPAIDSANFNPFLPAGVFGGFGTGVGAVGAAATIFFAYVGFDAVSTAAEETKNPQRNVPIGLIGSLLFCTVVYILVAAGAIGTIGGQPIMGPNGIPFPTGSEELARQCAMPQYAEALVCSNEALAHVLRQIGFGTIGNLLGYGAILALAVGHPDPAVRPDPHLLRHGARRPASRGPVEGPPEVEDALCRHRDHRRHRRDRRGVPAGRPARRYRQCGNALRLPDGGRRGDAAAPPRSGPQARLQGPRRWRSSAR